MSNPAFPLEFDDGFGTTLSIGFAVLFVVSLIATYLVLKIFDRFFRTEISEEHLARIIATLEQGQTGRQTLFEHMTEEERRNVLEKVLLRKPYTEDILKEIATEREHKALSATEEGKEVVPVAVDDDNNDDDHHHHHHHHHEGKKVEKLDSGRNSNDDQNDGDDDVDNNKDQSKDKDTNILEKLGLAWPKFSSEQHSQNDKNDENDDVQSEEDYDNQCLICMDSYEIGTDVAVGHKCMHMYHTRCLLKWMCAKHDFCPLCRKYLFDVKEFRDVAQAELTKERFSELVQRDHPNLVAMYMSSGDTLVRAVERANNRRSDSNFGANIERTNREPEYNHDDDGEATNGELESIEHGRDDDEVEVEVEVEDGVQRNDYDDHDVERTNRESDDHDEDEDNNRTPRDG